MAELDFLLKKVEGIHQQLGGNAASIKGKKGDKFSEQRLRVEELLHLVECTQDERNKHAPLKAA